MKKLILVTILIVFVLLYYTIQYYTKEYYSRWVKQLEYGIPRIPSPLKIYTNQIELKAKQESFSQTMQDTLATIGSYTSKPVPMPIPQQSVFNQCIDLCNQKMNKCIAAGNPTTCEYNYEICRQDCGWTSRQVVAPQREL